MSLPALLAREIDILPHRRGTAAAWTIRLRDAVGDPITEIPPAAPLSCRVWDQPSGAVLASPAVAWLDAGAGTIALDIKAADVAIIVPGRYRIEVLVTLDAQQHSAWIGELLILGGPGA